MALIKCPECGREISDKARECPHCGVPIAAGKTIPVRFWRERKFVGGMTTGTILIDGNAVGSAQSGTDFEVQLSPGEHNILIQTLNTDTGGIFSTRDKQLSIPSDAKKIDIEIVMGQRSGSFLMFGIGEKPGIEVKEIKVIR